MPTNLLQITSSSGESKSFPLDQVVVSSSNNVQYIQVPSGRKYKIKSNKLVSSTLENITYFHRCKNLLPTVKELSVPLPKKLNYFATLRSQSFQEDYIPTHRSSVALVEKNS
jgi:hypothetical protein